MFKSQNFCHIASNNRNQVKVGVFVYRTTDDLATVLTSGYFNDRIIDINLHDLIIHEKVDNTDATKVERNILCVTERTLENVGTSVIKSKWEGDIEQDIADIEQEIAGLDNRFVKLDGTSVMTGPLLMRATESFKCAIAPCWDGVGFFKLNNDNSVTLLASMESPDGLTPATDNTYNIGKAIHRWKDAYVARVITSVLNNGYDIAVPVTNSADTLALKSEVDLAANSGRMITDQGVWYAKMYAGTTAPAADDDTNYADFSQTDGQGNPIIVIYTRTSGAWVQSETITPPAEYDGYVPITSKIWDIAEQTGQQGGRVLWNHQSKDFTPYPQIISFDGANITNSTITTSTFSGTATLSGNSTVTMPLTPTDDNIVNKKYVDDATAGSGFHPDILDWKWADHQLNDVQWLRADTFSWQDGSVYESAYQHLVDEYTSSDWTPTRQESKLGNNTYYAMAYDGTKFVALSGAGYITTSTDGITWTAASPEFNSITWNGLAYNGTKFVALQHKGWVSTSTDGITWSEPTQDASIADNYSWKALACDGTKFVALGTTGFISTSTNGTTWTTASYNSNLGSHGWNDIIYDGTKFVAIGANGYISTSTDGTTWSAATQNTELHSVNYWQSIAYDGTTFIAINKYGYTSTSPNGTTWTTPIQNTNLSGHNWYTIAYGGAKFVVLGSPYNVSTKTPAQEETVAGITIEFCLASDGHKICAADQESNVAAIYAATGVAWYYILDTVNERFKLPRAKALNGAVVGNGIILGLTNGTINGGLFESSGSPYEITARTGAYGQIVGSNTGTGTILSKTLGVTTDSTKSGMIVERDNTDQHKYLYFYVGAFTQTALENTAGITTEEMNNKADKDDVVGYCSFNTGTRVQITSTNQTAAKNGWLLGFFSYTGNNASGKIYVNDIEVSRGSTSTSSQWGNVSVQIPVKAGQTYRYGLDSSATLQSNSVYFYPDD